MKTARFEFQEHVPACCLSSCSVDEMAGFLPKSHATNLCHREAKTPTYVKKHRFNDPDIKAQYATFASPEGHGEGRGYLVRPAKLEGKAPVVLVVHENRGLNPYIKDVARRLAKAGFVAFAPDALHSLGGYPGG